jgi:decaprenyl-phosphate phosphoribosyltransferase
MLRSLIITLRPWQWIKNLFVVAPLVFSSQLFSISMDLRFLAGFIIFSLISSAVYGINDIADLEKDRNHPFKKKRPLASGAISPRVVLTTVALILAGVLPLAWIVGRLFFITSLLYLVLNLFYSFVFKRIAVLDAIMLALGFVLRVWAGTSIAMVEPSGWIMLTTFFLALFLAFCKRRQEVQVVDREKLGSRSALSRYNVSFLDEVIILSATCAIMCFSMFALSDYALHKFNSRYIAVTVPVVVFGMLRYLHLMHFYNKGEDPTMTLLTDVPLQLSIILWFFGMIGIIYFSHA